MTAGATVQHKITGAVGRIEHVCGDRAWLISSAGEHSLPLLSDLEEVAG